MGNIWRRGLCVCLLIALGFGIVVTLIITYGEQVEAVYIGNEALALAPIYNRNGSWFHGKIGIGQQPLLYFGEQILTLLMELFILRFMTWLNRALGLSAKWNHLVDFMFAVTIARTITLLTGNHTLDYVYIAKFHATYDLFDFYLGITIVLTLIWCVLAEIKFLRLKKKATPGMNFWQKMKWELLFTWDACKAAFVSTEQQERLLQKYEYSSEII